MLYRKKNRNILAGIFLILSFFVGEKTQAVTLSLTDTGTGINRVVTIESSGQFRIAFEAVQNFGLSKWYDLVNDPGMNTDLAQSHDLLVAQQPGMVSHESGSLFTQVFSITQPATMPNDTQTAINCQQAAMNAYPEYVASLNILENTAARVVIQTHQTPQIDNTYYSEIKITTEYFIYPDGKIYITNSLYNTGDRVIAEWRNSVLQLQDPTGLALSNRPDTTGWIRSGAKFDFGNSGSVTEQNPLANYYNSNVKFKYLFMYWGSDTPPPNTDFTKASVLIIPSPLNNSTYQGNVGTHGNLGYKRLYYAVYDFAITPGQNITQNYLIQLGTQGSSVLPNLKSPTGTVNIVIDQIADAYINSPNPPTPIPAKNYNISNFTTLISNLLKTVGASDINLDGIINTRDLGIMMSKWE